MNAVPRAIGQEIYSYYYYIWSRCQLVGMLVMGQQAVLAGWYVGRTKAACEA